MRDVIRVDDIHHRKVCIFLSSAERSVTQAGRNRYDVGATLMPRLQGRPQQILRKSSNSRQQSPASPAYSFPGEDLQMKRILELLIVRSTVLAVILFLSSIAVVQAQSKAPDEAMTNGAEAHTRAVLGSNYVHAVYCFAYFDGTTTWFYVVAQDGGVWFTNNVLFEAAITPACQTGNLIAFNVVNLGGIQWNQVVTFPSK